MLKVCTHLNITSGICAGRPPQGGFVTSLQSFAPVDNRESITPLNENTLYCQQVLLFGTIFILKCLPFFIVSHKDNLSPDVLWLHVISELDGRGEVLIYN